MKVKDQNEKKKTTILKKERLTKMKLDTKDEQR